MPEIITYRCGERSVYMYSTKDYAEAIRYVRNEFHELRNVADEYIAFAVTTVYTGADGRPEYHSVRISPRVWAEVISDLKKYQFLDVFVDRASQNPPQNVHAGGGGGGTTTTTSFSYPATGSSATTSTGTSASTSGYTNPTPSGYQNPASSYQSPTSGYQSSSSTYPQSSSTSGYQQQSTTPGYPSNYPSTTGSGSGSSTTQSSNTTSSLPSAAQKGPSTSSSRPTR